MHIMINRINLKKRDKQPFYFAHRWAGLLVSARRMFLIWNSELKISWQKYRGKYSKGLLSRQQPLRATLPG